MMFQEFKRYCPGVKVTARQRRAVIFAERRGFRFCVDFGYQNAAALVREIRSGRKPMAPFSELVRIRLKRMSR